MHRGIVIRGIGLMVVAIGVTLLVPLAFAVPPSPPDMPVEVDPHQKLGGITDDPSGQHHGGIGGHLPASSENVELVAKLPVHDAAPGLIADVATFRQFAYLAQFAPGCSATDGGGVYVIDISNPASPREVGFIPARAGSFPGEGLQVIHVGTRSFQGDLLAHNNEICALVGRGGFSLWDVTNPLAPTPLVENFGDTVSPAGATVPVRQYHSVFVWQQAGRAYLVASDDEEQAITDVDIFDISDPRNPRLIKETGLRDWPMVVVNGFGGQSFNHDMVVEKIGNTWTMLISYWDAGYVKLDVNDPKNPILIDDSDFSSPDPQFTTFKVPAGNAHYAEFDRKGRFIIGTDEDFGPTRADFLVTAPAQLVGQYQAAEGAFTKPIASLPGGIFAGELVHVGRGCPRDPALGLAVPDPYLADPAGKIALIERGLCRFDNKIARAQRAGAIGAVVYNNVGDAVITMGGSSPVTAGSPDVIGTTITIPGVFVGRSNGLAFAASANPVTITVQTAFDGWGYIHLLDAVTLSEIDTYVVPAAARPENASGVGTMSVHEVEFDHNANLAYLAWYDAGLRVVKYGLSGLQEVGHFIDEGGNDFWGAQHTTTARGQDIILASDRDFGLYIFRYTGPRP